MSFLCLRTDWYTDFLPDIFFKIQNVFFRTLLGSQKNWAGSTETCHILPPLLLHPTQAFRLNVPHQDIGQSGWTDTDTPLSSIAYTGFSLCWMFYGVLTNIGWQVSTSSVVSLSFNMSVSHLYSWWIFLLSIAFSGHFFTLRLWEFAIL